MKNKDKIINTLFVGFIFLFMFLHIALPDKTFSPDENRILSTFPSITLKDLSNGTTARKLETYIQDQFPYRSKFVSYHTKAELLLGKESVSSTYILSDKLAEQFILSDTSRLEVNLSKINSFAENTDKKVSLLVIPSAIYCLEDELPENRLDTNQDDLFNLINEQLSNKVQFIDTRNSLLRSEEYPFYKTDHHLTLQGTSVVYNQYHVENGYSDLLNSYTYSVVSEDFKGSLSSKSGALWIQGDTISKLDTKSNPKVKVTIIEDNKRSVYTSVYFKDRLNEKDKYTYYLDGNHALVTIETNQEDKENLLVIGDSYGHALAPFVVEDYNKITFIDLRYYKKSVSSILKDYDNVLVYYGVSNLATDNNLSLLR